MVFYFPPMQPSVFFPHGVSNFEQLAAQGYVFVDKTPYIEKLEIEKEKFVSFLRPRRFGKSLFLSMLEYYYDILYKDRFEELFSKYYIGKNPTPLANSYRVLVFDFSGINTTNLEAIYQEFHKSVRFSVDNFLVLHNLGTPKEREEVLEETSPQLIIKSFFRLYRNLRLPERIYLLIDEYDHFTHEILTQDLETFQRAVSFGGYVRKFYEVIKSATRDGVVDKIFITGVSPITLDGLTSGFNILTHLTSSKRFASMMGFSEAEVRSLLRLVLEDPSQEEAIMQDLRYYYNGYRFSSRFAAIPLQPRYGLVFLETLELRSKSYPEADARYQYRPGL
jgi:hypothetical protein